MSDSSSFFRGRRTHSARARSYRLLLYSQLPNILTPIEVYTRPSPPPPTPQHTTRTFCAIRCTSIPEYPQPSRRSSLRASRSRPHRQTIEDPAPGTPTASPPPPDTSRKRAPTCRRSSSGGRAHQDARVRWCSAPTALRSPLPPAHALRSLQHPGTAAGMSAGQGLIEIRGTWHTGQ